jgi:hypothetical protein
MKSKRAIPQSKNDLIGTFCDSIKRLLAGICDELPLSLNSGAL